MGRSNKESEQDKLAEASNALARAIELLNGLSLSLNLQSEALQCKHEIDRFEVFSYMAVTKELLAISVARLNDAAELLDLRMCDLERQGGMGCGREM